MYAKPDYIPSPGFLSKINTISWTLLAQPEQNLCSLGLTWVLHSGQDNSSSLAKIRTRMDNSDYTNNFDL